MSSHPPLTPDRSALAGEYALGLLDGAERAEVAALAATDPAFAAEVARWSARFAPLLDEIDGAPPPPALLARIEAEIAAPRAAPSPVASPPPAARAATANVVDLTPRLRRWQVATGGMTALAASLALALLLRPAPIAPSGPLPPPGASTSVAAAHSPMVATLEGGANHLVASWNGADQVMVVPAGVAAAPHGHTHELWMIPKDGKPRSMGVMPDGPMKLAVQPATATMLADGATFAVSVEPMGGSPTGQPTGPVIASGRLVAA
ncbi:anti-sigma factor [Sphingomonas sp. ASV193]|uniref:anti-sigma factor n=1 Tax=Sphingomonas sp. ASV193 TaxID=3144405 RepID=UPI0032E91C42